MLRNLAHGIESGLVKFDSMVAVGTGYDEEKHESVVRVYAWGLFESSIHHQASELQNAETALILKEGLRSLGSCLSEGEDSEF